MEDIREQIPHIIYQLFTKSGQNMLKMEENNFTAIVPILPELFSTRHVILLRRLILITPNLMENHILHGGCLQLSGTTPGVFL